MSKQPSYTNHEGAMLIANLAARGGHHLAMRPKARNLRRAVARAERKSARRARSRDA